jgi:hypothetical protein
MKNLSGTLKYIVAGLGIVALAGCATWWNQQHCPCVEITPAMNLAKQDFNDLNRVLKTFDKSLYKIETYKKGKVVKTEGTLTEDHLRKGYAAEVANAAQKTGFTGYALQAGFCLLTSTHPHASSSTHPAPAGSPPGGSSTHPTPTPPGGSSTHPSPSPSPSETKTSTKPCEESDQLMNQIEPILKKYHK